MTVENGLDFLGEAEAARRPVEAGELLDSRRSAIGMEPAGRGVEFFDSWQPTHATCSPGCEVDQLRMLWTA